VLESEKNMLGGCRLHPVLFPIASRSSFLCRRNCLASIHSTVPQTATAKVSAKVTHILRQDDILGNYFFLSRCLYFTNGSQNIYPYKMQTIMIVLRNAQWG
jgi:hypothetical protein